MAHGYATYYEKDPPEVCRLCGAERPLTFEHIPPKRCFNNSGVLLQTLQDLERDSVSPTKMRKGMGKRVFCSDCNNWTASQYGAAFAEWTRKGMEVLEHLPPTGGVLVPFTINPGRVAKQVATMILAMSDTFRLRDERYNLLRRIVMNPGLTARPAGMRVFVYFAMPGSARLTGLGAPIGAGGRPPPTVCCEIARPPFGYCVAPSWGGAASLAASLGMAEITCFFEHHFNDIATYHLRMACLKANGVVPLEYGPPTAE